ncbi:hypothetical protein [Pseudomonas indica]|uniref:Uncharacterized protein n=1 Tax=Pseudomonas indica TaxID=137658 RepID=A0A1G9BRM0_9PSED|nr:hypothetical protein [Pseudomonas indica]MBU3055201.1 hypothetical protein [Pseudomonas indica]PAU58488.1 hypothetical protein BZL42_12720 [Pseudomonas indica]SDK42096.1 hypothetical protein SAMN05216186_1074 [Pseudomonas indica]
MKKLIIPAVLALLAVLFIGYYKAIDDAELNTVFFIKKYPTFQMKFENLFANDADNKKLHELNDEERQLVIDYCKYRLGIETELRTQGELEACKQR